MKLSDSSIRRPVTTAMIAVGLLVFGIVGVSRMPVDTLPKITVPMIIVGTVYPGAGPQEIESSVTLPLEKQLGSTPSLKKISSRSIENISVVTLVAVVSFAAWSLYRSAKVRWARDQALPQALDVETAINEHGACGHRSRASPEGAAPRRLRGGAPQQPLPDRR